MCVSVAYLWFCSVCSVHRDGAERIWKCVSFNRYTADSLEMKTFHRDFARTFKFQFKCTSLIHHLQMIVQCTNYTEWKAVCIVIVHGRRANNDKLMQKAVGIEAAAAAACLLVMLLLFSFGKLATQEIVWIEALIVLRVRARTQSITHKERGAYRTEWFKFYANKWYVNDYNFQPNPNPRCSAWP